MRQRSEKAYFRNNKASCVSRCFSLAWFITDSEAWATDEGGVGSDCCVLAVDALHHMFSATNEHPHTGPYHGSALRHRRQHIKRTFLAKENLHEDQERPGTMLFSPGDGSTCGPAAHRWGNTLLQGSSSGPRKRASARLFLFLTFWGRSLLVGSRNFPCGDLALSTPGVNSAGNRSLEYCTAL